MRTWHEPARELPVRAEVDILVVGGGPSGIMAAKAAAGNGRKVMLLESRGYLGGRLFGASGIFVMPLAMMIFREMRRQKNNAADSNAGDAC